MNRRLVARVGLVLVVGLTIGVAVVAAYADGRSGADVSTNDGGAWLVNGYESAVGHVNRATMEVTTARRDAVGTSRDGVEVSQAPDSVVVHDAPGEQLIVIDDRVTEVSFRVEHLPPGAEVHAIADGVAVVTPHEGGAWVIPNARGRRVQALSDADVLRESDEDAELAELRLLHWAVSPAGVLAVLDAAAGEVQVVSAAGEKPSVVAVAGGPVPPIAASDVRGVSFVAEEIVVVTAHGVAFLGAAEPRWAPLRTALSVDAVVETPGTDGDGVVVVDAGRIVKVAPDGTVSDLGAVDGAEPLPPIAHDGCVYGVTKSPPQYFRSCGGEPEPRRLAADAAALSLRLVNGWIWVTYLHNGSVHVVQPDGSDGEVLGWGAAIGSPDDTGRQGSETGDSETEELEDRDQDGAEVVGNLDHQDGPNEPPTAADDTAATRRDRPVVIPVLANDEDPNGDVLMIDSVGEIDGSVGQLELSADGQSIQLRPAAGFPLGGSRETVEFTYRVGDGREGFDEATVTVVVDGGDGNSPPTPERDIAATRSGEATSVDVLANDSDPEGDSLVLVGASVAQGQVRTSPSGTLTYIPAQGAAEGRIDVTYKVRDDFGEESEGTLTVAIRPPETNNEPTARNDAAVGVVGVPMSLNVLHNDTDPDGDPLTVVTTVDDPLVSLTADGYLTYVPDATGPKIITYEITDGAENARALVRLEATESPLNRPPVAIRDDVFVHGGTSVIVDALSNDSDPDGDVLSIIETVPPEGVETEIIDSQFIRVRVPIGTPSPITIPYAVTDGSADAVYSALVVAVVEGASDDQPPIAIGDFIEVRPGIPTNVDVLVNDVDPEGMPLTLVSVTALVEESTAEVVGSRVRLVARDASSGFTFAYEVEDAAGNRASAAVGVRIIPANEANRAPEAIADTTRSFGGAPAHIDVLANDRDPDGDAVVLIGYGQPKTGSVVRGEGALLSYVPDPGFVGTDTFTYQLADANGDRATGHVTVGVVSSERLNNPPTANDDTVVVLPGRRQIMLPVLVNDSDPDGDVLTIKDAGEATVGEVTIAPGNVGLLYAAPELAERAETYIPYEIADGRGGTARARATVIVDPEAEPQGPVAIDDIVGPVTPGTVEIIDVLANDYDPDGDLGRLELVTVGGGATITDDGLVRIAASDRSGRFEYTIVDQDGENATGYISVVVFDNLPPAIAPVSVETTYETPVDIDLALFVTDPDGDTVFVDCCFDVRNGSTGAGEGASERVSFTPNGGFSGHAGFSFRVDDGHGNITTATATVMVVGENTAPEIRQGLVIEVPADGDASLHIDDIATDADPADTLQLAAVRGGSGAIEVRSTTSLITVAADVGAAGDRTTLSVAVTDGEETVEGEITVVVTEVEHDPPRAYDDRVDESIVQEESVTVDVLANDDDPAGRGLTIAAVSATPAGTASINDGQIRFTAARDFFGTARFSYTIEDATGDAGRQSSAWVEVPVIGVPDAPAPPAVEAESGQVTITWVQPSANGSPIEGYELVRNDGVKEQLGNTTSFVWREGIVNGTTYSFRVSARNAAGQGPESPSSPQVTPDELPGVPGAPTLVTGDKRITISWDTPPNEGSEITAYEVRMYDGTRDRVRKVDGGATSMEWTELVNGRSYTFSVAAENGAGKTKSGRSSTDFPAGLPDAPTISQVLPGDRAVEVHWTEPFWNGHDTDKYIVTILPGNQTFTVTGQTSYRWANLVNGQPVRFQVRAENKAGQGPKSGESEAVVPSGPPAQPGSVAAARGDQSATVTWTSPFANGARVERYVIQALVGGSQHSAQTVDGEPSVESVGVSRSFVYPGLTNGTAYTFRIKAYNVRHESNWSSQTPAVTPAGPPFAPTGLSGANTAPRQVRLTWSAPGDNGSPITHYELSVNGGAWSSVGTGTSHTWPAPSNSTTYQFRVRAVNDVDAGSPSDSTSVITWGVPGQVGTPSASAGNGQVTLSWSAPSTGGTPITGYDLERRTPNTVRAVSGSPLTWTGLSNGTTYEFRVRAKNAVGNGTWSGWRAATPQAPPPPAPQIWKGPSAQGMSGCTVAACRFVYMSASGLPASTSVTIQCQYNEGNGWTNWWTTNRTTSSAGNVTYQDSNTCYWGYPGDQVRIVVHGRISNVITW